MPCIRLPAVNVNEVQQTSKGRKHTFSSLVRARFQRTTRSHGDGSQAEKMHGKIHYLMEKNVKSTSETVVKWWQRDALADGEPHELYGIQSVRIRWKRVCCGICYSIYDVLKYSKEDDRGVTFVEIFYHQIYVNEWGDGRHVTALDVRNEATFWRQDTKIMWPTFYNWKDFTRIVIYRVRRANVPNTLSIVEVWFSLLYSFSNLYWASTKRSWLSWIIWPGA